MNNDLVGHTGIRIWGGDSGQVAKVQNETHLMLHSAHSKHLHCGHINQDKALFYCMHE